MWPTKLHVKAPAFSVCIWKSSLEGGEQNCMKVVLAPNMRVVLKVENLETWVNKEKATLGQRMWTLVLRRRYPTKPTCYLFNLKFLEQIYFHSALFHSPRKTIYTLWRKLDHGHYKRHLIYLTI